MRRGLKGLYLRGYLRLLVRVWRAKNLRRQARVARTHGPSIRRRLV